MQRDTKVFLMDIVSSIQEIEVYTNNINDLQTYSENMQLKRAVERNLEIIGEAVKHIPEDVRVTLPEIEWRKISGLRDILIHAYFHIEDEIIWNIIKEKLPQLKLACLAIVDKLNK